MKTSITVVLDRSGSMGAVRDDAIGGFNAFLEDQRRAADGTTMTLTRFDHDYEILCVDRPVEEIAPLTRRSYVPRGRTALNDAIGRTALELRARLEDVPRARRPERVLFVILTDGMENASREFTHEDVRELIADFESRLGWTFVYLGADVDAFEEARSRGIAMHHARAYDKARGGTAKAFADLSSRVARYKLGEDLDFRD